MEQGIKGTLHAAGDARTAGIVWTFVVDDPKAKTPFFILKPGDWLCVFSDAARETPVWEGEIDLTYAPQARAPFAYTSQGDAAVTVVRHQAIMRRDLSHGVQKDVDTEAWKAMFDKRLPAILIHKQPTRTPRPVAGHHGFAQLAL